jgi:hypothetical protein
LVVSASIWSANNAEYIGQKRPPQRWLAALRQKD